MNLRSLILAEISKVPDRLIRKLIEVKLGEFGIASDGNDQAIQDMVDRISRTSEDTIELDFQGHNGTTLRFTREDGDLLRQQLDDVLRDGLEDMVNGIVRDGSQSRLNSILSEWPGQRIECNVQEFAFQSRLNLRWGNSISLLRLLLLASREFGEYGMKSLRRSKANSGRENRLQLHRLHVRACQVTTEIITLLEAGLADGALARWRTLYEILVVANVIHRFGDDEIALRYADHEIIALRKELENQIRPGEIISKAKQEELNRIIALSEAALDRYGACFTNDYGWAAHAVGKKNPRFRDLELSCNFQHMHPLYKLASYRVHASASGLTRQVGRLDDVQNPLAGRSNAGLDIPGVNTAYTLVAITYLIIPRPKHLERVINMSTLVLLRNEIEEEFNAAALQLMNDHNHGS